MKRRLPIDPERAVKIVIRGRAADDDRPSIEDVLKQVRAFFELLAELELATHPHNPSLEVVWRIARASMNSPLSFWAVAEARQHGFDITERAMKTKRIAVQGIRQLSERAERPAYFNDQALELTQELFNRVTNGLSQSDLIDLASREKARIVPSLAASAERNVSRVIRQMTPLAVETPAAPTKYKEIGTVEGLLVRVDRWRGRPAIYIRSKLFNDEVLVLPSESLVARFGDSTRLSEVWRGKRVIASGIIEYDDHSKLKYIRADDILEFGPTSERPTVDDIFDRDFSGGLSPLTYLEELRAEKT